MNESHRRQEEIFSQALALPAEERAAFLDRVCGGDAALRRGVEELLQAHLGAGSFLGASAAFAPEIVPGRQTPGEVTGERIGRYTLIQKLGEGGAGVVYEAEQEEPVQRRVALKLMKFGTDSQAAIARFEAERQALALMEHPNIAQVFDAGSTANGRLYFAMELVRGVRITDYCDQNRLPPAARLQLFIQVCHAVQHAHQKGIIHRDLKPSNILVTVHDGVPVPKVIDFGIAKATQGPLTEHTQLTAFEQLIGTPAYMSPEQAAASSADIDTRSDVYSLGVLLYELLTGRTPFDTQELLRAGIGAVQQAIREREPPRPSTRLSTTEEGALAAIAAHRGAEPPKLIHQVRGDLDWIVMKALEKDRGRRYATANEFAADVERHLHDEPVVARPPTTAYVLRQLARRHRTAVAAGVTIFGVLAIASAVSAALAIRATRAEAKARTEAARSAQVAQFLKDMLSGVGPSVAMGRDTTLLSEILDKTAKRLDTDLKDQPEVEAELRRVIGGVYGDELHKWVKAEDMFRRALALQRQLHPTPHPAVVGALFDLADLEFLSGDHQEAASLFGEIVTLQRQLLGPTHPVLARALYQWALPLGFTGDLDQAEAAAREAIEIYRQQPDGGGLDKGAALGTLATVLCRRGDPEAGDAAFREAMTIARSRDDAKHFRLVADMAQGYGMVYDGRGDEVRAESLYTEWLEAERRLHGDNHPEVAKCRSWVGWAILPQGDFRRALAIFREAEAQQRKLLGDRHPFLSYALEGRGCSLLFLGDFTGAEAALREATEVAHQKHGSDNNGLCTRATFTLAVVLFQSGRRDEAVRLSSETLAAAWKDWPDGQSNVFAALSVFENYELDNRISRPTEAILLEAVARQRAALGAEHPAVANALSLLGALRCRRRAFTEAEADFREALAIRQKALGSEDRATAQSLFSLGVVLRRQSRAAEAEPLLQQALALDRRSAKEPDQMVLWALNQLGRVQVELGRLDEAEASFREGMAIAPKIASAKHEDQADACDGLGVVLARQGKFAEAETALRDACRYVYRANGEGLRDLELPRKIAEHLIQLYADWSKIEPARAAAAEPWKKRLPDLAKVEATLKRPFPLPPEPASTGTAPARP
jgi:eukaryotic-like serine/threonine-protein kinase